MPTTVYDRADQRLEEIKHLYLVELRTLDYISKLLHTPRRYISEILRHHGINTRTKKEATGVILASFSGRRFGLLTVIGRAECASENWGRSHWVCRCKCGKEIRACRAVLMSGDVTSCPNCSFTASKESLSKGYMSSLRRGARLRYLEFNLSCDFLWNLYLSQGKLCAISGVPIMLHTARGQRTASLDRIDADGGYTEDNVQWVHKIVNMMKGDLPEPLFVKYCGAIAGQQKPIDKIIGGA